MILRYRYNPELRALVLIGPVARQGTRALQQQVPHGFAANMERQIRRLVGRLFWHVSKGARSALRCPWSSMSNSTSTSSVTRT